MKLLKLSLIAMTVVLTSTFAQADQKIEKTLGQCQVTKATVLKSKNFPKGKHAVNTVANISVARSISVINPDSAHPGYYDESYLNIDGLEKTCLPMGCITAPVSSMTSTAQPNGPQQITYQFKANSSEKLDLLLSEPDYTDWVRLTYDYKRATGKIEVRTKINDWSSTTTNNHFVYEIANCNFQGPISLNASQK